MTDIDLLIFGCAVTFIVIAGGYVFVRERFTAGRLSQEAPRQIVDDAEYAGPSEKPLRQVS